MILTIDLGTTNLKVGLFRENGSLTMVSTEQTPYVLHPEGYTYIPAQGLWKQVQGLMQKTMESSGNPNIRAVSITSMAESGLLMNPDNGRTVSEIIPWFDPSSVKQASFIEGEIDSFQQFCQTGLHVSFKHGLSKLLWLREQESTLFTNQVVWLSVSSFIAYCLTGVIAEEKSLAARTFVYQIDRGEWDKNLISHFGLSPELFPPVTHCLEPIGAVKKESCFLGLNITTNVYIAGHDHVSSSLAAGVVSPGSVYNSMGTAETLVGTFIKRKLTKTDYQSGLSFGLHPLNHLYFWMGGHSSSGGSVEWMRDILGDDRLTYAEINRYLELAGDDPSGIIFCPYLTGRGAPDPNPNATAAFLGLKKIHGKTDLLKAVLEGNAYQMELLREEAEKTTGMKINRMSVIGGGVRNPHWIQIKANISGSDLILPNISEAALCGAALISATGEGIFSSLEEAVTNLRRETDNIVHPNKEIYDSYRDIYENQYKPLSKMMELLT